MPADANAHYNLGNELDALDRHSEALAEFEKAARLKPKNSDIQFNLGIGYFRVERYAEGRKSVLYRYSTGTQ